MADPADASPYGRSIASTVTLAHPTWWASKGFLVVIQDVRGGDSGGCFGGFAQEASDPQATHAWVKGYRNAMADSVVTAFPIRA